MKIRLHHARPFFGLLGEKVILQVEDSVVYNHKNEPITQYRDATPNDLINFQTGEIT